MTLLHCTEVEFISFLSCGFTIATSELSRHKSGKFHLLMCIGAHLTNIPLINSKITKENVLLPSPIFDQNFTTCSSVEKYICASQTTAFYRKTAGL